MLNNAACPPLIYIMQFVFVVNRTDVLTIRYIVGVHGNNLSGGISFEIAYFVT